VSFASDGVLVFGSLMVVASLDGFSVGISSFNKIFHMNLFFSFFLFYFYFYLGLGENDMVVCIFLAARGGLPFGVFGMWL